ncbi:MAG: M20/M25/M40 family metallo-hydrolase [Chlorobia bacterium]|nr:M20/M25/M40 family metallo-hydrolase [Fimbriimonadaceae bacterium]
MKARILLLFPFLLTLALAQYPGAKRVPGDWRSGFNSIKESDAKDILGFLAGPELRGRGSLTPDFFAAAGYVAGELRRLGLTPAGENGSYFQRYDLVRATTVAEGTGIENADGSVKIPFGNDFQVGAISDMEQKVRFAFVNIPPTADLSTFNWESLKGRVVIYTSASARNPAFAAKLADAREQLGVEQMILVAQARLSTAVPVRATGVKDYPDPRSSRLNPLRFSQGGIKRIADSIGVTKFFVENPTEFSVELSTAELTVKVKTSPETTPLLNVLAKMEGSDPAMSKETVMIASHLDHLGVSNDGIRYGADDNGSGCTANLMIAKALLLNPVKPKRSVLFAFWSAEEVGLWGSYAFVSKPTIPLTGISAYFNLDMLGRNEETGVEIAENNVDVVYPGTVLTNSRDFYDRLVANNAFINLRFKPDKTDRTNRTDTRNFVWKGVPTVKVFTGEHPDYHRAGDTIDKINWTKLVNISRWIYLSVADLATRPDRPKFERKPFVAPDHYVFAGRATFKEKILLSPRAQLVVELIDPEDNVIAGKEYPHNQGRTPFELLVPKAALKEGLKYKLRMCIREGQKIVVQNTSIDVPATGWTRAQEIVLAMPG